MQRSERKLIKEESFTTPCCIKMGHGVAQRVDQNHYQDSAPATEKHLADFNSKNGVIAEPDQHYTSISQYIKILPMSEQFTSEGKENTDSSNAIHIGRFKLYAVPAPLPKFALIFVIISNEGAVC